MDYASSGDNLGCRIIEMKFLQSINSFQFNLGNFDLKTAIGQENLAFKENTARELQERLEELENQERSAKAREIFLFFITN